MAKYNGVVSGIWDKTFNDGGEARSIKIEGSPLYFRLGKKKWPGIVEKGNLIEFFAEQTDEKAAKVTSEVTLSKKAAPQETAQAATGGAVGAGAAPSYKPATGSVDWAAKDASIQYQSSRKDALTLVGMLLTANAVAVPAAAAKKVAFLEALVDKYTASFYTDIGTQAAVARSVPAEKPKAVVEDESEGDEEE